MYTCALCMHLMCVDIWIYSPRIGCHACTSCEDCRTPMECVFAVLVTVEPNSKLINSWKVMKIFCTVFSCWKNLKFLNSNSSADKVSRWWVWCCVWLRVRVTCGRMRVWVIYRVSAVFVVAYCVNGTCMIHFIDFLLLFLQKTLIPQVYFLKSRITWHTQSLSSLDMCFRPVCSLDATCWFSLNSECGIWWLPRRSQSTYNEISLCQIVKKCNVA